ncbi:MAG TPA: polysaccharide deacetylase family protein [Gemmatimonadaceae bacterium]|nr:polysaccharide deacetylase family protein [Gemmatimonadaceae bacterium]
MAVAATANGDTSRAPAGQGAGPKGNLAANRLGRIPVLEYHVVGDSTRGQFIISRDKFEQDLQLLYDRGYRPITVSQLLDKDFRDVPAGMSPVVFTFDDASPEQFSYVEQNGKLEIDPKTVIGMWVAFNQKHPDWKNRATFCLLPAAQAGHAFFGDNPKYRGQKKEWRFLKVKWLADNGFELCNHTLWHAQLNKYPDAFVQEQIARGAMAIDSAVPGYKIRTFALPQGLWPKNRALAWRGSWTDPKSGKTVNYAYETVLEVSGGPVRSPFDPQFDKTKITRLIAFGNELQRALDGLDANKSRFVWDGGGVASR